MSGRSLPSKTAPRAAQPDRPGDDSDLPRTRRIAGLLAGRQAVLDGEIVAYDKHGRTDFGLLQQRIGLTRSADVQRVRQTVPVAYLIFDVLSLDGEPLLDKPYDERRAVLDAARNCR